MSRYLLWFPVVLFIFSCQEEVVLPLGEKDAIVPVIEAYWTDQPNFNEVKFSLAKDYYDTAGYQPIVDAEIVVKSERTGEVFPFIYMSGSQTYRPANPQKTGVPGERYTLQINWKDLEFQSSGTLLEPPRVDSVTWSFEEERVFRDAGYYVKVYGKIPFDRDNNYRIRVIENDTLKNQREDYLLFDDTFGLRFFEEGLELGYKFDENDRVRLELFRLNRDAFDYLNQLVNLLFNDGGLFSPPPQNPQSNIRVIQGDSEILGYFVVTPVLSRSLVIQAKYD
jgi:hypothetical protein